MMRYLWYNRPHPLRALRRFLQRGFRGWADEDTWNLNLYLAGVLAGGLEYLAQNAHGHPCRGKAPEQCKTCDCGLRWYGELEENAERFRLIERDEWYNSALSIAPSPDIESIQKSAQAETENREKALSWLGTWFEALWD